MVGRGLIARRFSENDAPGFSVERSRPPIRVGTPETMQRAILTNVNEKLHEIEKRSVRISINAKTHQYNRVFSVGL